jgi:hypothetical protein
MRKTYETPMLVERGPVVASTKHTSGTPEHAGGTGPGQVSGSVGFNL